jgi:hypothetical protein
VRFLAFFMFLSPNLRFITIMLIIYAIVQGCCLFQNCPLRGGGMSWQCLYLVYYCVV